MDHLLIHCHVANSLWVFTLQAFGIQWVLPSSVAELLLMKMEKETYNVFMRMNTAKQKTRILQKTIKRLN